MAAVDPNSIGFASSYQSVQRFVRQRRVSAFSVLSPPHGPRRIEDFGTVGNPTPASVEPRRGKRFCELDEKRAIEDRIYSNWNE